MIACSICRAISKTLFDDLVSPNGIDFLSSQKENNFKCERFHEAMDLIVGHVISTEKHYFSNSEVPEFENFVAIDEDGLWNYEYNYPGGDYFYRIRK